MNTNDVLNKLIAEIDKKWKELADKNVKVGGGKYDIEISTYLSIKNLITSLQQESKDKDVFIQKAIQWMCKTAPINDVLSVEMIEDFKKTMMEK